MRRKSWKQWKESVCHTKKAEDLWNLSSMWTGTGKTVAEINKELLKYRIFGGYDLSRQMPSMGQSMLVCVTEKTDFSDIDTLAEALKKILSKEE